MSTADFFRSRLDAMIDMRHPLVVLTAQLPRARIEAVLAARFSHQERGARHERTVDFLGEYAAEFGGGVSNAGRPRLSIRLMASLVFLKNSFNLSTKSWSSAGARTWSGGISAAWGTTSPGCTAGATQIGRLADGVFHFNLI